jgi:hypothetical protein
MNTPTLDPYKFDYDDVIEWVVDSLQRKCLSTKFLYRVYRNGEYKTWTQVLSYEMVKVDLFTMRYKC